MSEQNKQVLDTQINRFLGTLNNVSTQSADFMALHLVWAKLPTDVKNTVVNGLKMFADEGVQPSNVDEVFPRTLLNASPELRIIKRQMYSFC